MMRRRLWIVLRRERISKLLRRDSPNAPQARRAAIREFDEACFNGKKGDVIGPVKTEFGYHVILIKDQK